MSTKQEAMQQVYDNANEEWKTRAYLAVMRVAAKQVELTTDDVWEMIPSGVETHERRALGPIMVLAAKNGLIEKTGQWIETKREAAHQRPVALWRSKVFKKEAWL